MKINVLVQREPEVDGGAGETWITIEHRFLNWYVNEGILVFYAKNPKTERVLRVFNNWLEIDLGGDDDANVERVVHLSRVPNSPSKEDT